MKTTVIEQHMKVKKGVKATRLTADQMKADSGREYNPSIWEGKVNRISHFSDVQFFRVEKGDGYEYERYFVAYTLPEGLRLLNTFGYSSSITSGGFEEAFILEGEIRNNVWEQYPENEVTIFTQGFRAGEDEQRHRINTTPEARKWMRERSEKHGMIFTKCSL